MKNNYNELQGVHFSFCGPASSDLKAEPLLGDFLPVLENVVQRELLVAERSLRPLLDGQNVLRVLPVHYGNELQFEDGPLELLVDAGPTERCFTFRTDDLPIEFNLGELAARERSLDHFGENLSIVYNTVRVLYAFDVVLVGDRGVTAAAQQFVDYMVHCTLHLDGLLLQLLQLLQLQFRVLSDRHLPLKISGVHLLHSLNGTEHQVVQALVQSLFAFEPAVVRSLSLSDDHNITRVGRAASTFHFSIEIEIKVSIQIQFYFQYLDKL